VTMAAGYVGKLRQEQPFRRGLAPDARNVLLATLVAAATATALAGSLASSRGIRWTDFAVLAAAGSVAQLFAARVGGNQAFHTGVAFAFAAALVLPPELVVLVCAVQHVPDWLRHRWRWYVQTFNVANYALSGLAAWGVRDGLQALGYDARGTAVSSVLVVAAAAVAFVVVNHALLARMLKVARGQDLRTSGLFGLDSLVTDLVLTAVGALVAFTLLHDAVFAVVAVLPLLLIHRSLVVPTLREQAFRDHKTGLLNSRGFERAAADEFARSRRFGRTVSVLLCDVDDLREINNGHGHHKGDEALVAIADALRSELRAYDLCARSGGDEFIVLLPETCEEDAVAVGERIRTRLAGNPLETGSGTLVVGVSIGAVEATGVDEDLADVIRRADAAMYEAKRPGERTLAVVG